MAAVEPDDLVPFIRSVGLYNHKARALVGLARCLVASRDGVVPDRLEDLIALPGVARKTANVVLQNAFGIVEGFVVDTHVARLAGRLGLSGGRTPEAIERDLMQVFPRSEWARRSHQLILHGRGHCDARRPRCGACPLAPDCPGRSEP
jgi:endonuclease-3